MVILTELILIIQGIVFLLVHCTASPMDYTGYVIGLEALSIMMLLLYTPVSVWLEEREEKKKKKRKKSKEEKEKKIKRRKREKIKWSIKRSR